MRATITAHTLVEHAVRACASDEPVVLLHGRGGALVAAADHVSTTTMAFLVRAGSGFVQVALAPEACDRLVLPPMAWPVPAGPRGEHCVTVDAATGVTTGISAADRARTARLLAAPGTRPAELNRPGHVVPLRAADPTGLPAAARALTSRAGCAAAVLCSAVPDRDPRADAGTGDLVTLAVAHGLAVVAAADLEYGTAREAERK